MLPLNIVFRRPNFRVEEIVACPIEDNRTGLLTGFNIVAQTKGTGQFSILDTIETGRAFADRRIKELGLDPKVITVCPLEDRQSRIVGYNIVAGSHIIERADAIPRDYVAAELAAFKAEFKLH